MRRITGYVNGTPQWSENEPAYARLQGIRGALVQGEPGWREKVRKSRAAKRAPEPAP